MGWRHCDHVAHSVPPHSGHFEEIVGKKSNTKILLCLGQSKANAFFIPLPDYYLEIYTISKNLKHIKIYEDLRQMKEICGNS